MGVLSYLYSRLYVLLCSLCLSATQPLSLEEDTKGGIRYTEDALSYVVFSLFIKQSALDLLSAIKLVMMEMSESLKPLSHLSFLPSTETST